MNIQNKIQALEKKIITLVLYDQDVPDRLMKLLNTLRLLQYMQGGYSIAWEGIC